MLGFLLRRLAASLVLVFLVLSATFVLVHATPGEPARLYENPRMSPEVRQHLRSVYGLDRPLPEQYLRWLAATARGEWGNSLTLQRPVLGVLAERLPATALLALAGVGIELVLALTLALLVVRRPGGWLDTASRWLSVLAYATPTFVLAIVSIELFAVRWPLLPAQQMVSAGADAWPLAARVADLLRHLVLPATCLGLVRCGPSLRFLRNNLLEVLEQDFVRTARAKGLSEARTLWRHALPNAVGPLVQRLGVSLPFLLSGALVLEVVFAWPGLGTVTYAAVFQRDYPLVIAATALTAALVVAGSLAADLVHAWIDPRLRQHLA